MNEELSKPIWPVVVIDPECLIEFFSEDDWYSDADVCDASTWGEGAELVDFEGTIFEIRHTIVDKKKALGLIPVDTVTNL